MILANIIVIKKAAYLFISLCIAGTTTLMAQVTINEDNADPDGNALLDVQSTDKGVLIPGMTLSERNAISCPATGLMVHATSDNSIYFYSGSAWIRLNSLHTDNPADPIPIKFQGKTLHVYPEDNGGNIATIRGFKEQFTF